MVSTHCYYKVFCIDKCYPGASKSYVLTKKILLIWKHYLKSVNIPIHKVDGKTNCANTRDYIYMWFTCKQQPKLEDKVFMKYIENIAITHESGYEL
jgi:hypothetical protein